MSDDTMFGKDVSRRDAMKTALKAGAYAAPVVLAATVPAAVSAATPPPPPGPAPFTISASATSTNTAGNNFTEAITISVTNGVKSTTLSVFIRPNNSASPTPPLFRPVPGNFVFDANGNGTFNGSVGITTTGGAPTSLDVIVGTPSGTSSITTTYSFTLTTAGGGLRSAGEGSAALTTVNITLGGSGQVEK